MSTDTLRALVIGCPYHDFETNGRILGEIVDSLDGVEATVTTDKDELRPDSVAAYDVILDYMTDSGMTASQRDGFLGFVRDGGGYVGVHPAADIRNFYEGEGNDPELEALLGTGYLDHPEKTDVTVQLVDREHPITRGLSDYTVFDEPYRFNWDHVNDVHVLAKLSHEEMGEVPVAWTKSYGEGRVFYISTGHTNAACEHSTFQTAIARGVEWTAGRR